MSYNCRDCRYFFNNYCKRCKIRVESSDNVCNYLELTFEIKLPPNGRNRSAAVSAKKHVSFYIKSKRGSTDPELKELRQRLNLPPGFRLQRSQSDGSVYIKNANTKEIVRTLSAIEVVRILNT